MIVKTKDSINTKFCGLRTNGDSLSLLIGRQNDKGSLGGSLTVSYLTKCNLLFYPPINLPQCLSKYVEKLYLIQKNLDVDITEYSFMKSQSLKGMKTFAPFPIDKVSGFI